MKLQWIFCHRKTTMMYRKPMKAHMYIKYSGVCL